MCVETLKRAAVKLWLAVYITLEINTRVCDAVSVPIKQALVALIGKEEKARI